MCAALTLAILGWLTVPFNQNVYKNSKNKLFWNGFFICYQLNMHLLPIQTDNHSFTAKEFLFSCVTILSRIYKHTTKQRLVILATRIWRPGISAKSSGHYYSFYEAVMN